MAISESALSELLESFRAGGVIDLVRESVRVMLQELIGFEASGAVGAARYERSESRVTERNGSRPRVLSTQAGDVALRIPKLRKGSFFPSILEPRRRIDKALYAVVMEAYVEGVGTRSVDDLVTALGVEAGISRSEVSRICKGLDESVEAFRGRRFDHTGFPYVYLDATYLHVREASLGQVVSKAVVVAIGVAAGGGREILGLDVGDSEDEVLWRAFLDSLKAHGLCGVRLVTSDQHAGLVAALTGCLQGAAHQRWPGPGPFRPQPARPGPQVPQGHDRQRVPHCVRPARRRRGLPRLGRRERPALRRVPQDRHPDGSSAEHEVLAFTAFPHAHWTKIWSSNPLERLNKAIKRRSRVVGIFPDEASVIRLVGSVLADTHDEWQAADRPYLSEASMALLADTDHTEPIAAITGSE